MNLRRLVPSAAAAASMMALAVPGTARAETSGGPEHAAPPTPAEALHVTTATVGGEIVTVRSSVPVKITNVKEIEKKHKAGAGTDPYYGGGLTICALGANGICNPDYWWADDVFRFTTSPGTDQTWNNGTPKCGANHTNITWCSYVNNGTASFQEGFNFGNGGWARMDIFADSPAFCDWRGASFAGYQDGSIYEFSPGDSSLQCVSG